MREIKFRGEKEWNAQLVYGDLVHIKNLPYIRIADDRSREYDTYYPVRRVAQLIAVDSNGREVYEGDKIKRCDETDCDAYLKADFRDYENILKDILIKAEA